MNTMKREELLDKYYKGETSLEEEKELKQIMTEVNLPSSEHEIFSFFEEEGKVPDNIEEIAFQKLDNNKKTVKKFRLKIIQGLSVAAVILIAITFYINQKNTRNHQLEKEFSLMEQALYHVSQTIQPDEQDEMLVLWVNDDVQIIIN